MGPRVLHRRQTRRLNVEPRSWFRRAPERRKKNPRQSGAEGESPGRTGLPAFIHVAGVVKTTRKLPASPWLEPRAAELVSVSAFPQTIVLRCQVTLPFAARDALGERSISASGRLVRRGGLAGRPRHALRTATLKERTATSGKPFQNELLRDWFLCRHSDERQQKKPRRSGAKFQWCR